MTDDLVFRLKKRAEIRRGIQSRKSVQEGKPDRLSDLLEEAAERIEALESGMVKENGYFIQAVGSNPIVIPNKE